MKLNQKGFIDLIFIFVLVVIAIGGYAYYRVKKIDNESNPDYKINISKEVSELPQEIRSFVDSHSFPSYDGKIEVELSEDNDNLILFSIYYGVDDEEDCPVGCAYSTGTGLFYNNNIGWISLNGYDGVIDTGNLIYYDFREDDELLFSDDFQRKFKQINEHSYSGGYKKLVSADAETPTDVLNQKIEELTSISYGCIYTALKNNPTVLSDSELKKALDLKIDSYEYDLEYYTSDLCEI